MALNDMILKNYQLTWVAPAHLKTTTLSVYEVVIKMINIYEHS